MSEENTLTNEAENYIVTARKWRPLTFADVVGQDHITQTLKNAVISGRMHHAYLFCGPRGVGKTTTARIMARAVNCLNSVDAEPCNKCINCQAVLEGRSVDVIEIDGASNNSVDDIRKLRENAKYPPSHGKYKMYVIDEVHMLSSAAFNALLKTLEEPPPHLMFVFATTEAHKVLPTITSRCQRYDFRRMETGEIVSQLKYIAGKESITIDEKSLMIIAKRADGSMRDSQSIFDQVIAFCGKNVDFHATVDSLSLIDDEFYFRISRAASSKNTAEMFHIANEIINRGYDLQETLSGLLEHLRHLLTVVVTGSTELIEAASEIQSLYQQESKNFRKNDLLRMMNLIAQSEQEIRFAKQPRVKFELTLCKLATMDTVLNLGLNDITIIGLIEKSGNARFAYDSYRRFVAMYGDVVMGLKPQGKDDIDPFEEILEAKKHAKGITLDIEFTADDLKELVAEFKAAIKKMTGQEFPEDPMEQLWGSVGAVFSSWMNDRATKDFLHHQTWRPFPFPFLQLLYQLVLLIPLDKNAYSCRNKYKLR
jgi:DNA polymerase III subunit gamma/tau